MKKDECVIHENCEASSNTTENSSVKNIEQLIIRPLRLVEYNSISQAMRLFTDTRSTEAPDEIWLIEHKPVYTLGQAAKLEHILNPGTIPIEKTDRGGQVTYH